MQRLIKAGADTDILEELEKKCQEDYNQNYINSDLESVKKVEVDYISKKHFLETNLSHSHR